MHASMKRFATILCHAPLLVMLRRVGGEEQELKDGEVLIVRCRSVYVLVYVLYNIPNILSSTATGAPHSRDAPPGVSMKTLVFESLVPCTLTQRPS